MRHGGDVHAQVECVYYSATRNHTNHRQRRHLRKGVVLEADVLQGKRRNRYVESDILSLLSKTTVPNSKKFTCPRIDRSNGSSELGRKSESTSHGKRVCRNHRLVLVFIAIPRKRTGFKLEGLERSKILYLAPISHVLSNTAFLQITKAAPPK